MNVVSSLVQPESVKNDVKLEVLNVPIAFPSSVLLGLIWISIDRAGLCEELGDQTLLLAVVVARVVTVTKLVGSSHCRKYKVSFSSFMNSGMAIEGAIERP